MKILEFNRCWHPFFLCLLIIGFTSCRSEEKPTPSDNTPDAVTFKSATELEVSTLVSSDEVTISGISGTVEFVVSNYEGAGLSVNGAAPVTKGTLKSGDKVKLQLTTPDEFKKSFSVKIKIGTEIFEWQLTTKDVPGFISFTNQQGVKVSTSTESPEIIIKDIMTPQTISVSGYDGAQLVINDQAPVTSGQVVAGDKVKIIFTTPPAYDQDIEITVKLGEIESTWKVTTQSPPVAPSINKLKLKAFGKEYEVVFNDNRTAELNFDSGSAYAPSKMPVLVESIALLGEGTASVEDGGVLDMDDNSTIQIETSAVEENILTNEKDTNTFTVTFSTTIKQLSGFDRLYTPPTDDELNRFVKARGSMQSIVSYKGKLYYILCNAWDQSTTMPPEPANNTSVWRSDDGTFWEKIYDQSTAPDDQKLAGFSTPMIVYKDKIWLFGGKNKRRPFDSTNQGENSVWNSEDGMNWNVVLPNEPASTATDRFTWSAQAAASVTVHNGEMYLITGRISRTNPQYTNEIWKSSDGEKWTLVPDADNSRYTPRAASIVSFKGKLWVIGGYDSSSIFDEVWSSDDGTEWVQHSPTPGTRNGGGVLVHDEKLWVMSGSRVDEGNVRDNEVWSSVDGDNWVQVTDNARFVPRASFGATVHDGKMWIVGGAINTSDFWANLNDVWSSENGKEWIDHKAFNTALYGHTATMYNNKLWLIGGSKRGEKAYVWASEDGRNWIKYLGKVDLGNSIAPFVGNTAPFEGIFGHSATVFNGKLWVVGGYDQTTSSGINSIWYTTDGFNWTEAVANGSSGSVFDPRYDFTLTEYKGKLWVIGGDDGSTTTLNEVWSSTDGQNWTQETNAPFSGRRGHSAVIWDDKLWIIGGHDKSDNTRKNDLWSFDGTTWTEELSQDEAAMTGFTPRSNFAMTVIDNQMIVLGGSDGSKSLNDIWGSYDGKIWFKYLENDNNNGFSPRSYHKVNIMNGKLVVSGGSGSGLADIWISR